MQAEAQSSEADPTPVTEEATDTIKETLKTDEIKKDMDDIKNSLAGTRDVKKAPAAPPAPPAASAPADQNAPKTADPKPQA